MMRIFKIVTVLFLFFIAFSCGRKESNNPVILISIDTLRADHLSCYGGRNPTDAIDSFAKDSYLFEDCITPIPITLPSHTVILTGLYPYRNGVRGNGQFRLDKSIPTVAESFKEDGWNTSAFVSGFSLYHRFGLDKGFDIYEDSFYDPKRQDHHAERKAEETLNLAVNWLKAYKDKPLFTFIHLYDPHKEYDPPEPFKSRFKGDLYDGEIAYVDYSLQGFFKELKKIGLYDRSLIILVGDHGESLGEHGEDAHGTLVYQSTLHVPFCIKLTGQKTGKRITNAVSTVDIVPTITELAFKKKAGGLDGVSLVPIITGGNFKERTIYFESLSSFLQFGWAPLYGQKRGKLKFIEAPDEEGYDLNSDANEKKNLFPTPGEGILNLKRSMRVVLKNMADIKAGGQSREETKALMSLGYIGGTAGKSLYSGKNPMRMISKELIYSEAVRLVDSGKIEEGQREIEKILKGDPSATIMTYYLAKCYTTKGDGRANEITDKLLKEHPSFTDGYVLKAKSLFDTGKFNEAKSIAEIGIKKSDDYGGMLHTLLGIVEYKGGNIGISEQYFKSALEKNPDLAQPIYFLAAICANTDRKGEAISYLDHLVKTSSDYPDFYNDPAFSSLHGIFEFEDLKKKAN